MKLLKMALLAGSIFAVSASQAQTVQEIVDKHNVAVGGVDAWSKVNSYKMEIQLTQKASNQSMMMRIAMVNDKAVRIEQEAMGQKGFGVVTPTSGWSSDGSKTKDVPADKAGAAFTEATEQYTFTDELVVATQKKYKMELQGKEKIGGKDAWKISVIDGDADETIYFVDAASYFIVRQVQKTEVEGEPVDVTYNFGDFKKVEPLGLTMAMTMNGAEIDMKYKNVEVNKLTETDPIFTRPTN